MEGERREGREGRKEGSKGGKPDRHRKEGNRGTKIKMNTRTRLSWLNSLPHRSAELVRGGEKRVLKYRDLLMS